MKRSKERWGGGREGGEEGRKRLQTNSWILKTAHTHTEMSCCRNLWPSVAEVNFVLGTCGIKESDAKIKGTATNCVAIASAVIVRFRNTKALALCTTGFLPYCRSSQLNTRCVRKVNAFCEQSSNVLSGIRNFTTFDRYMSIMFD